MLLRRYGSTVQSVEPDFRPHALNEISFRRDREHSFTAGEFEGRWEHAADIVLDAEAEGDVHNQVEEEILESLMARLREALEGLDAGEVLLVENESGVDWPRTRQETSTVLKGVENRLHFKVHLDPPLRLGRYRER
jgi:hypothetical protein